MEIKLILFDFDGTLVSSVEGIASCMGRVLRDFGYSSPTLQEVKNTAGLTLEDSITKLTGSKCTEAEIPLMVKAYRDLYVAAAAPLTRLFEGAVPVLAEIKRRDMKSVLVSNKGSAGLHGLLNALSISQFFDLVLTADRVRHTKPSAALYHGYIASEFSTITPEEILVVGDTESDLLFARNIGAKSCWAAYGYGRQTECMALGPNFTILHVAELTDLIDRHSSQPSI